MFGAGARVFHHPASRDLPRPALREQHVFGVLGKIGVFLGRGREGLGSVWVLSLVFFLIPSPRPVLIPTGKPELSRPVDSEWLSVCLQAGEQLSSRAKI